MAIKAIVGIDDSGFYQPALDLLRALQFPDMRAHLVYCVESVLPDGSFPPLTPAHPIGQIISSMEEAGKKALQDASAGLSGAETILEHGDPSRKLLEHADRVGADLVVAGSTRKSALGSLFFGSVSKALVTRAKTSILIGKEARKENQGLTAVYATDHSVYSGKVVDLLLQMAPKGITRLIVMTADNLDPKTAEVLYQHRADAEGHEAQWAEEKLRQQNEALVQKLSPICGSAEAVVVPGNPNEGIERVMRDSNADLLILGAQGHGFMERLTLGSVSMHQAVASPHNVLVLRP